MVHVLTPMLAFALCAAWPAIAAAGSQPADRAGAAGESFRSEIRPFLANFCSQCHGGDEPEADLKLDDFKTPPAVLDQRETWESILEYVRLHEMPPEGEPQPDEEQRTKFVDWVEAQLAQFDWSKHRHPGRVTMRRLNRTEYNNTIRDLVGVDFRPADDFPADDVGHGFDNIGDVLTLSPILLEKYLAAAEQVVQRAMAEPAPRRRILIRQPSDDRSRDQCAREVLSHFATRAFRRPATPQEVDRLIGLVQLAEQQGADYPRSLEVALQAILASPHFLFRIELDDHPDDPAMERPLNDYELATRLSYFLWSSMPDDELFGLAEKGQLTDDSALAAQVRRMLRDPKSIALVDSFAAQWLQLRNLDQLTPDPDRFPAFDPPLREAMISETKQFFLTVMRDDRSILDFIDSDYTFLNQQLARHYGVPGIVGDQMRQVSLNDGRRGGLLTHASILTLTSNPTRTSPVKRGKWILDNILGAPPPPPPPGVQELKEGEEAELLGSLRERMEQHRADPSCAVCHRTMDALGFGFENFDAIGAWRDRDGAFEIDASGQLPGNQQFRGPQQLRSILRSQRKDQFVRCLSEKMLTYALGRGLQSYDRGAVDDIVDQVEQNDGRFSSLVLAVAASQPFRYRGSQGESQ
jgi:mono/diheme cytochrome c family protein